MNRFKLLVGSAALLGVVGIGIVAEAARNFDVDTNHTIIGFTASTLLFDVQGHFDKYKVQVSGDPDTLAGAQVRVEIDVKSINTNNKTRNEHLQGAPFFDSAKYPKITFTSTSVKQEGTKILVEGNLDMHGVSKPLKIPFEAVSGVNGAGVTENVYKAEIPLNRKDFGIGSDSIAAKISLKDQVVLKLLLAGFFGQEG